MGRSPQRGVPAGLKAVAATVAIIVPASLLAMAAQESLVFAVVALAISYVAILLSPWKRKALNTTGLIWFTASLLCFLFLPALSRAREAARRTQCRNNLKQISIALLNYHDKFGCYPLAFLRDAQGSPTLSWRVVILPYIDESRLFDKFDLSEPWNGPHNRTLTEKMPPVYACPSDSPDETKHTSYVGVVGQETVWPEVGSLAKAEILDGLENTIQLVEIARSDIVWTEPKELPFEAIHAGINPQSGLGISSLHSQPSGIMSRESGVNAAFADGRVHFLDAGLNPATLAAMLTRSGGESVRVDWLRTWRLDPARVISLSLFLLVATTFAGGVWLAIWKESRRNRQA